MRAALYARKSTEERVAPESKSVTRQIENARAYAERLGFEVVGEFSDDAISGAEDERRRPGLRAVLAGAARGAFEVLVVAELKALSREMIQTGTLLKRLADPARSRRPSEPGDRTRNARRARPRSY